MSDSESSEIYSPDSQQRSEQGRGEVTYKRRLEKTNKNTVEGKWTDEEHLKYVLFMIYHLKTFVSKEKRKYPNLYLGPPESSRLSQNSSAHAHPDSAGATSRRS
jgi:hypothetical protein